MVATIPFRSLHLSTLVNDQAGEGAAPLLLLAHGANGGMRHPLLEAAATALSRQGIGILRFNFPYQQEGKKSPNSDAVLIEAWSAVLSRTRGDFPGRPLLIGGKSLGGRTAAASLRAFGIEGIRGLVFLGFPLHAPGRTGLERGLFLRELGLPCFFGQGTRDSLANPALIRELATPLQDSVVKMIEGGDHSLRVRGENDPLQDLWRELAAWIRLTVSLSGS